ncbi:MAG: DUF4388 domain-containing protein [Myxococcales bacterium]|nr:DUF4388 domain-containing protein [Myxococcales bacterium]
MSTFETDKSSVGLEGDLARFRPEEILQFIGTSEKTGILVIDAKPIELQFSFVDGRIASTRASERGEADISGQIFVRAGIISPSDLEYALDIQRQTLKRLGAILVELAMATWEQVAEALALQIKEDVLRLLRLSEGPFHFRTVPVEAEPNLAPVAVEHILLDCLRVMDEWPTISGDLPAFTAIPTWTDLGGEGAAGLAREELELYEQIDGHRTLREVIDRSRLGDLEGAKAIAQLIARGYVVVHDPDRRIVDFGARLKRAAGFALGATVLLALAALSTIPRIAGWEGSSATGRSLLPTALDQSRLEYSLETFKLVYGDYPQRLDQLATAGLYPEDGLSGALRNPSVYQVTEDAYALRLPRPNP